MTDSANTASSRASLFHRASSAATRAANAAAVICSCSARVRSCRRLRVARGHRAQHLGQPRRAAGPGGRTPTSSAPSTVKVRCRAATSVKCASTSSTPTRYGPAGSSSSAVTASSSRPARPRRNGSSVRPAHRDQAGAAPRPASTPGPTGPRSGSASEPPARMVVPGQSRRPRPARPDSPASTCGASRVIGQLRPPQRHQHHAGVDHGQVTEQCLDLVRGTETAWRSANGTGRRPSPRSARRGWSTRARD